MEMTVTMNTERFTLFWHGPFSQFHPSTFAVEGTTFTHAEQFMMYSKAKLFGDHEVAAEILRAEQPKDQKALGRKVRSFDDLVWKHFILGIVFIGSYAKYSQNTELKEALLATMGTTLVEASPLDRVW